MTTESLDRELGADRVDANDFGAKYAGKPNGIGAGHNPFGGAGTTSKAEEEPELEVEPIATFDVADWNGKLPPRQHWVTDAQIPCGKPGILSGDGGLGKTTIAMQLHHGVGLEWPDWLGKIIETHGPSMYMSVEESRGDLHRLSHSILARRGIDEVPRGRLHLIADEKEPLLAKLNKHTGLLEPTMTLIRLEKAVKQIKPVLVVLENAADLFGGNEIDRTQVTHFVRVHLGTLCTYSNAAVMLLQHPSVAGLTAGDGRSGSTAWNNSGRWRLNLTSPKRPSQPDDDEDDDTRDLQTVKLNKGKRGEKIRIRWKDGVFVPDMGRTATEQAAVNQPIDDAFMRCLHATIAQGRKVGPNTKGSNYAPRVFAGMPESEKHSAKAFEKAMTRMLSEGRIILKPFGPPSKQIDVLGVP